MADELEYDARLLEALHAELAQDNERWEIERRLISIANAADTRELDRAGALALLAQLGNGGFLAARLREHYAARYLRECSGRYALVPERADMPGELDAVADAVTEAGRVQLHIQRGSEVREVDYIQYFSLRSGLDGCFEAFIRRLPIDYRRQTEWLQQLYDASRFTPREPSHHPNVFLRMLAMRRRTLLQFAQSTLLFVQVTDKKLHELPMWAHQNAALEIQLEQMSAGDRRRELMLASLARGDVPWMPDPDVAKAVRLARRIVAEEETALLIADTRCWFTQIGCTLWTGPRTDPRRSDELRYFGREQTPEKWAVVMLDGSPRLHTELHFTMSFEPSDDLVDVAELSFPETEALRAQLPLPSVSVFFEARDVPTTATLALTLAADHVALGTLQIGTAQRVQCTTTKSEPLDIPRRKEFPVLIRRETRGVVLEVADQHVVFETQPARLGFVGIAVHGAGFVGIRRPQLLGNLTSPS